MRVFNSFSCICISPRLISVMALVAMTAGCVTNDHLPDAPRVITRQSNDIVPSGEDSTQQGYSANTDFGDVSGPIANPHRKIGNPYKIDGVWYYPEENKQYDNIGTASWYGEEFHNKLTANGEVFDMNQISAAHPTLPLPTTVKVTNIENGRSIVLRVNDRGPFAHDREIDLSRAAAEVLGYREKGLATVRVEYLEDARLAEAITKVQSGGRTGYANKNEEFQVPDQSAPLFAGNAVAEQAEPIAPTPTDLRTEQRRPVQTTVQSRLSQRDIETIEANRPKSVVQEKLDAGSFANAAPQALEQPTFEAQDTYAGLPAGTIIEGGDVTRIPVRPVSVSTASLESSGVFGQYIVQVGAFSSNINANAVFDKLSETSNNLLVRLAETSTSSGAILYRVRLGPYASKEEAENGLAFARRQGFEDAHILRQP